MITGFLCGECGKMFLCTNLVALSWRYTRNENLSFLFLKTYVGTEFASCVQTCRQTALVGNEKKCGNEHRFGDSSPCFERCVSWILWWPAKNYSTGWGRDRRCVIIKFWRNKMAVENGDVPPSRACQGLRPVPDPSAPDLKPVSDLRFSVHISLEKNANY